MRAFVLGVALAFGASCDYIFRIDYIDVPSDAVGDGVIPPGRWQFVSAGDGSTCGITVGGELFCWGYNGQEQLGIGAVPGEARAPVQVGSAVWLDISVGFDHACGLQLDRSLWCWGNNDQGQLGLGNTTDMAVPIRVGSDTWSSVVTGGTLTCSIRASDHHLFCWGQNNNGQLGIGSTIDQYTPTEVSSVIEWQSVSIGELHTCGLDTAGIARCWGGNFSGEIGDSSTTRRLAPTLTADSMPYDQISAGHEYTCGVRRDGRVLCWGDNSTGNLGTGSFTTDVRIPTVISSSFDDWAEVRTGSVHTCGRRTGGATSCWGDASPSMLPDPTNVPVEVATGAAQIAVGRTHTCILTSEHGLACSGDGSTGQLGDGTRGTISTPVQVGVLSGSLAWTRLEAGDAATCSLDDTGRLFCWGDNLHGQVADGTSMRRLVPVRVNDKQWTALSLGRLHGCAIENGVAYCWGANLGGSIGNNSAASDAPVPLTSPALVDVQAGDHTCALEDNGTLWCWGTNDFAEAGQASLTTVGTPTMPTAAAATYGTVATGYEHTCVISKTSTALSCWGSDQYGQVGNGSASSAPVLTPATVVGEYSSVVAAPYRTCAASATTPGQYLCWGLDSHGELLGNGAAGSQPAPVAAAGRWKMLALGLAHTCGIAQVDDTLWCWGRNRHGQIGDGSLTARTVAVRVGAPTDAWRTVTAGTSHTCAMKMDQSVWCWGSNRDGQLGTGIGWTKELVVAP